MKGVHAEQPVERTVRERERFSSATDEGSQWEGRACSPQHAQRQIEADDVGHPGTSEFADPVAGAASDLHHRAMGVRHEAAERRSDSLERVRLVPPIIVRRDGIVIYRSHVGPWVVRLRRWREKCAHRTGDLARALKKNEVVAAV
jgi:hypothetical protein